MGQVSSILRKAQTALVLALLFTSASALFAQGHIRVAGGTPPDRQFLSVRADGDLTDLWGGDDGSGRQRWILEPVRGGRYFHIRVVGGTPYERRFLSVTPDGGKADLWQDDGSGRQLWLIEPIPGSRFVHIRVAGGTPQDRQLLSVSSGGDHVDLFSHDDGSGRQQWFIEGFGRGRDDRRGGWDRDRQPPPPPPSDYRRPW